MNERKFMAGSAALSEAAIGAGCRFYSGYPIRPITDVEEHMIARLEELEGGAGVAAASELEAITMVAGAAAGGTPSMTASSGTGLSLMQETMATAGAGGFPIVVVNGTRFVMQSDYHQSVKGGGHGDYRVIVVAPSTIQEIVDLTHLAFQLAWKYRHPALILLDAYLLQASETVELKEVEPVAAVAPGWAVTGGRAGRPRVRFGSGEVPDNDEDRWSGNPVMNRRLAEIAANEKRFAAGQTEDADLLIAAYGSVSQSVETAVAELRTEGASVGYFRPITLWPFPEEALRERAKAAGRVLCVELNQGQMVEDVRAIVGGAATVHSLAGDGDVPAGFGKLWSPAAIVDRAREVLKSPDREGALA